MRHPETNSIYTLKYEEKLLKVPFGTSTETAWVAERKIAGEATGSDEKEKEEEVECILPKNMLGPEIQGRKRMPRLKVNAALDLHRRIGHLHVPGNEVECPERMEAKGQTKNVRRYREPEHETPIPLEQLNADFWGPINPTSIRGNKLLFVMVCDASSYVWVLPLETKDMATAAVEQILDGISCRDAIFVGHRVVQRIKTDNEPAVRDGPWQKALKSRNVEPTHSAPYIPQQNGVVERMMRTLGSNMRSMMNGVDKK